MHQQFPEMKCFDISKPEVKKFLQDGLLGQLVLRKAFGDAGIHKKIQALVW
jgi:hypothetical protein